MKNKILDIIKNSVFLKKYISKEKYKFFRKKTLRYLKMNDILNIVVMCDNFEKNYYVLDSDSLEEIRKTLFFYLEEDDISPFISKNDFDIGHTDYEDLQKLYDIILDLIFEMEIDEIDYVLV